MAGMAGLAGLAEYPQGTRYMVYTLYTGVVHGLNVPVARAVPAVLRQYLNGMLAFLRGQAVYRQHHMIDLQVIHRNFVAGTIVSERQSESL